MNESSERGNIFVWGHFGKKLQKLDNNRYLAITQNSPNSFLAKIYNNNIEKLLLSLNADNVNDVFDKIEYENYLDNLFRQVALYMRNNADMLSIGSALTGELEKSGKLGRLVLNKMENDSND